MSLRERARLLVAGGLYYSGLIALARSRKRRQLIILNYHRAAGKNLRHQMRYLSRHYRVLHLEEALEELYTHKPVTDRRPPIVLTFDDGYLDNYTCALKLARQFQIPITVFLIPGYTESGRYFWWLAGDYLARHTKVEKVTLGGKTYQLAQAGERAALARAIDQQVREATSVAERETFLKQIQQELEVRLPERSREGTTEPALPITWDEAREMERTGLVSFGAHTMWHPVLSRLSDPAELQYEVTESRRVLEEKLGHPVRTFAYPIGKDEHFGEAGVKAVRKAGFSWAVTTVEEVNTPNSDPLLLARLPGDLEQPWLILAAELVGLLGIVSRIKKRLKHGNTSR
ncbi:polysaccharide deacetylase [Thermosporothrix hazakensis]|uniref:Polysaccharide deacetylase n=1 Tax=Thermosporothrix hazakensis TaxID=644383 RepID=A0A326UCD6_THEHA|nr:polysaccharide deacetylase family protein [Thermosporothrix hazakensis]PZW36147.1 polysaccharide deacetylase [Thermosporothrix hazakensis]GCE46797.1 hypothetical protein KTH_16660 [Thermosporothrix hazakensis]